MSSLNKAANSFVSDMAAAAAFRSGGTIKRNLAPSLSPSPSVGSTTSAAPGGGTPRKDRVDTPNIVYSQPAATGTGESMMTQLSYAVKWLREKGEAAQPLDAILGFLSVTGRGDKENEMFVGQMRKSNSIEWIPDPNLTEQTWRSGTYRHRAAIPNVRDKAALLRYLQRKPDASGVSVKDLKDGWPDCEKAIDDLERIHKLLVIRQKKDGAPRMVWLDDQTLHHDIDPQFKTIFNRVEVPNADVLVAKLAQHSLKAASEDPRLKKDAKKSEKKKARRNNKTQKRMNTHINFNMPPTA